MKHLKRFNEEIKFKDIVLSTAILLGVGLSKSDAQTISRDTTKSSIVRQVYNYNKGKIDYQTLKNNLGKFVNNVDFFMKNYLECTPKKTYIIKANFIPLQFDYNAQFKTGTVTYKVPLKK